LINDEENVRWSRKKKVVQGPLAEFTVVGDGLQTKRLLQ
jgi:hypothetical protein